MAVVAKGERPVIPLDCPPRLNKFINVCWDQKAKARPPFTTIVKAIESGEVVFPGTNMNAVRAYVTRFAKKAAPEAAPAPTAAAPAPSGPEDLVKKLATPEAGAALRLIRKQIGDARFLQQLQAVDKLMPNLIKACESCNSADMAADILAVFTGIAAGGKGVTPQHVQRVFQVFFNFGTTQMKEVLVLIPRVLPILRQTKLTGQQFVKIAAFLQTSDVVTRIESTVVLKSMIEQGIYDKPESIKNLFPYIISNCSKDAVPDLLQPSLEIVALLLQVAAIKDSFVTSNGLQAIVSIFTVSKPDAVTELAIRVFATVLTTILLPEEAIRAVIAELEAIFGALKGDTLARFLAAFTGLLNFKSFYKEISTNSRAAPAFEKAFQNGSPAARLIALKIIYALLVKATTHKAMVQIAPVVVPLLRDKNEAVVTMAAAVLVSAVPDAANQEQLFTSDVSGFLMRALGSENSLTASALRLAGAWSNSLSGAQLLEQVGVVPKALALLTSSNGIHQRLALMFAAAFSSAYPMSKRTAASLPLFIQAMRHEQLHPYPLIFLSNVVMAPEVAQYATGAFNIFAILLGSQQETVVKGALTVVLRVVSCSEALGVISDKHVPLLIELFKATEKLLNSPLFVHVLEVISALSGTAAGKAAVTQTNLPAALNSKLEKMPKKDPHRPTLMRILARCR
jgi:hypothetical protein